VNFSKPLLIAAIGATFVGSVHAAPFTPGNVVIYRVGAGTSGLVNTGAPVFLDEYTASGSFVQSIAMPTLASGANNPLIASGVATSEGLFTRSEDGRYLLATGYATTLGGTLSLSGTTGTAVPRVVGRVDVLGNVDTSTDLTDFASGNNPRSATSTNGTDLWVAGGAGGIRYTTLGASTSTQLSTTVSNVRQVSVFDGQLYTSTGSGSTVRIGAVGTGVPTTAGQTITNLTAFPTGGSPYAYHFADLSTSVAGLDTLYVADDGAAALTKYSLVSGSWTSNGTIGVDADDYRGLTGFTTAGGVQLFATRKGGSVAAGGGELVALLDASGYNGSFSGTPTLLATAATNTAFRGIALAPVPEPSTYALMAAGLALVALGARRRRARRV